MKKFEYIEVTTDLKKVLEAIDKFNSQGWVLCGIRDWTILIFKRELKP